MTLAFHVDDYTTALLESRDLNSGWASIEVDPRKLNKRARKLLGERFSGNYIYSIKVDSAGGRECVRTRSVVIRAAKADFRSLMDAVEANEKEVAAQIKAAKQNLAQNARKQNQEKTCIGKAMHK